MTECMPPNGNIGASLTIPPSWPTNAYDRTLAILRGNATHSVKPRPYIVLKWTMQDSSKVQCKRSPTPPGIHNFHDETSNISSPPTPPPRTFSAADGTRASSPIAIFDDDETALPSLPQLPKPWEPVFTMEPRISQLPPFVDLSTTTTTTTSPPSADSTGFYHFKMSPTKKMPRRQRRKEAELLRLSAGPHLSGCGGKWAKQSMFRDTASLPYPTVNRTRDEGETPEEARARETCEWLLESKLGGLRQLADAAICN